MCICLEKLILHRCTFAYRSTYNFSHFFSCHSMWREVTGFWLPGCVWLNWTNFCLSGKVIYKQRNLRAHFVNYSYIILLIWWSFFFYNIYVCGTLISNQIFHLPCKQLNVCRNELNSFFFQRFSQCIHVFTTHQRKLNAK